MNSTVALVRYITPLAEYLNDPTVEEIVINRPGEAFVERAGVWTSYSIPDLDLRRLGQLADLVATFTHQKIGAERPLLSAHLPSGERIQIIMPPACPPDMFGVAIRKPSTRRFSLADLEEKGVFDNKMRRSNGLGNRELDEELMRLAEADQMPEFLRLAVLKKKNILISGGTSSGKTTILRAMVDVIPEHERLLTIEDVPELTLPHKNKLHLLASRGAQGVAKVSVTDLLEASLRLRPDRVLLGEMRGAEAADFLELINTGHPGSISTIHADSPMLCFERLSFMVKRRDGFQALTRETLINYIKSVVDIVVQFNRFDAGMRGLTGFWFRPMHDPHIEGGGGGLG